MSHEPTERHIASLRSGDPAAWRIVVTWLQPRLDGFFIAGRAADHEALTQETLLRMSRSIERFTEGGPNEFAAWAFAIARTTRIDAARRAAVRPQTISESQLAGASDASEGMTQQLADTAVPHDEQLAALDRVEGLFAQLTDQQAELLRLRIHGDVTLELAARTLGMELGAAKQLQRRALRRLATLLAAEDDAAATDTGRDDDQPTQLLPGRAPSGTPP